MQHLSIVLNNGSFEVHGLPPDSRISIKIDGHQAKQLGDHMLHQTDLEFADQCLDAINLVPDDPPAIRQALWRSAIISVMKCFGANSSRSSLSANKVLKGLPPEAIIVFDYFKHLRNKYIAHDENAWTQVMTGAALNDGSKEFKVEMVFAVAALAQTLEQANYGNLKLLIRAALDYSREQFELLTEQIKRDLETFSYEELAKRDPPVYRAPEAHEVSTRRS